MTDGYLMAAGGLGAVTVASNALTTSSVISSPGLAQTMPASTLKTMWSARFLATASTIAANAPISVRQAKKAIHHGLQMSLADGMALEIEAYNRTVPTEDRREGIRSFNEKRRPLFTGR